VDRVAAVEEQWHAVSDYPSGGSTMRGRAVVLAAAIAIAPLGARGADLVVWWEKGFYPQEDEGLREIIAAFEQGSGKQVELALYSQRELGPQIEAALEDGQPPDFAFGTLLGGLFRGMGL
jgi:ABC-type glycerol-3-phosphate transport system substrate-binding protein